MTAIKTARFFARAFQHRQFVERRIDAPCRITPRNTMQRPETAEVLPHAQIKIQRGFLKIRCPGLPMHLTVIYVNPGLRPKWRPLVLSAAGSADQRAWISQPLLAQAARRTARGAPQKSRPVVHVFPVGIAEVTELQPAHSMVISTRCVSPVEPGIFK